MDTDVSGTFIYKNSGTARFQTHCRVNLKCEGTIYGTKGKDISKKYARNVIIIVDNQHFISSNYSQLMYKCRYNHVAGAILDCNSIENNNESRRNMFRARNIF